MINLLAHNVIISIDYSQVIYFVEGFYILGFLGLLFIKGIVRHKFISIDSNTITLPY
jgi:hypothetical protein